MLAGGHSGVARYAATLSRSLDRVAPEFPSLRLEAVTTPAGAETLSLENIPASAVGLPRGAERRGWVRLLLEQIVARRERPDLMHFFDLIGPMLSRRRPFVATLYDASVTYDFEFPPLRRTYKRYTHPWTLRHARAVVAISAFSRDEAVRRLGGDPDRIRVIHPGPGLTGSADGDRPRAGPPYLLFVGTLTEHKNVPFLVRAYDGAGVDADLILAGRRIGRQDELVNAIREARAGTRIRVVEDASDEALDGLYRSALALLHPARYEGFGFTPLEAMTRGCPVLASDIPALREISGDGALMLPLDDETAWAEAIRRVVADEALRADLRRRGNETASRYSWDEAARQLCELFLELGPATSRP
jgi:glycosyltransferase involved in cell wall biosynthesis